MQILTTIEFVGLDKKGIITTLAGNGRYGYRGDNNLAVHAELYQPSDLAFDKVGNLYIVDRGNHRIRKVDNEGIITLVAGYSPYGGYWGDGGPATQANLNYPSRVAVDSVGNLYIADTSNDRVRKSGPEWNDFHRCRRWIRRRWWRLAIEAQLNKPSGVAVDSSGNLYIADSYDNRIRKVDRDGIISTVAGNGTSGYSGDGGRATEARLDYPARVVVDAKGNLYIVDEYNHCVRKVDTNGIITTIAGNGLRGYAGDNGPANQCQLNYPRGVGYRSLWSSVYRGHKVTI